jgi:hypothetical protein
MFIVIPLEDRIYLLLMSHNLAHARNSTSKFPTGKLTLNPSDARCDASVMRCDARVMRAQPPL